MKTLTLFFLIVCTTVLTVNAQITKGNWMVGGDANFNIDKAEGTSNGFTSSSKGTTFRISPYIGYFVADKFVVGLNPLLGFSNPEGTNNNVTSYSIGPFVRYYFLKANNRINLFVNTSYGFGSTNIKSGRKSKSNSFQFKTGPVIYFNSSIGLELTLNYEYNIIKNGSLSESTFNRLNLNIGFQIHLENVM